MNPFSVAITVFRNRCWLQPFFLFNSDQSPLDVSKDSLALVVIPAVPNTSGAAPVVSNVAPTVSVNTVVFDTPDAAMGLLTAGAPYTWQFLRQPAASGAAACSSVMVAGPLLVLDSPPMPSISIN